MRVRRWLRAGVMEDGQVRDTVAGVPQGGVISPLPAIYLHYVLDLWFERRFRKSCRRWAALTRYADDCAPRRRREEAETADAKHLAAQEMRVGPSDSGCRPRVQTTGCCSGPMAGVVSETEKAGSTRQVRAGKANVSEPLWTCRKRRDVIGTGLQSLARDKARGFPAYRPSGDRHEGGASPAQALVWNVGTFGLAMKGALQVADPPGAEYRCEAEGADGPVVATMPGNAGGATGPDSPADGASQPARGGAGA